MISCRDAEPELADNQLDEAVVAEVSENEVAVAVVAESADEDGLVQ